MRSSLIVLLLTISLSWGNAQDFIPIPKEESRTWVGGTYLFTDSTNAMTAEEIANLPMSAWKKEVLAKFSPLIEWIMVPFINETNEDIDKIIYLSNPISHEMDIYFVENGVLADRVIPSGLVNSRQNKLYNDPGYPYLVNFPANTEMIVLIKVHDPLSSVQVPIYLLDADEGYAYKDTNLILLFFWLGILSLSILLSLLLFFNTKQRLFMYYTFVAVSIGIVITSTTGVVTMFIDKDPYQIVTNYYQWGAVILVNFFPRFIDRIVRISSVSNLAWKAIRVLGLVAVGIAILYSIPFFKFSFFFTTLFINCVVSITAITFLYLAVTLAICAVRRKPRAIALFVVYIIYLSLGFVNVILPLFGVKNDTLSSIHIVLAGSALEIVAFMIFMGQAAFEVYRDRQLLLEQVRDHQDEVMQALVKGQEDERNRFARDLHDGFGGMISALNLNLKGLNSLQSTDTEKRVDVFNTSSDILNNMHAELKNICFDLMPQTLVKHGLEAGIHELANRINSSKEKLVEVNVFGLVERLTEIQEISIYRIVQEWINNILKHSDANGISVQVTKDEEEITLMIEDDGMGFEKSLLINSNGNGWKNLNSRANLISGEIELDTIDGMRGNTLILNASLRQAKHERLAYLEEASK